MLETIVFTCAKEWGDCDKMDRSRMKSSFRLARSQSLQRSISITRISPAIIEDTFWFGKVQQKIRYDWQPVWIRLNKRSILSYKDEVRI